jgi:hypothetical protein
MTRLMAVPIVKARTPFAISAMFSARSILAYSIGLGRCQKVTIIVT